MSLSPGTRLGPYEILAPLGAGGMGEVYKARDTRLNRDVAIKVLPDDFARDPARLQRFKQEAQAVAALNHPNIVGVYDVGENFIVSELVDGQTLRAAGKLPQRQAMDLAAQVADGLAAAHAAGIAHRDLKPENIMIGRDGRAKILDFGLAKITSVTGPNEATQTQAGMIMGTAGYMSPEQAKGLPADHRSDIFSFGLVLYEVLAGKNAFTGASSVEVMNAILKEDPPELPEPIAPGLKRIVGHCLDKNPDRRFQSASDLAFALQSPLSSGPNTPIAQPPRWRKTVLLAAYALAIAAISVAGTRLLWRNRAPQSWTGVRLGGPEVVLMPRLSPDGRMLAFVGADADGVLQVWVMQPGSGNRVMLTHDRERGYVQSCAWSADGSRIYYDRWFDQPTGIFSVPALGGDAQPVLENAMSPEPLPDGSLLLVRINPEHLFQPFRYWPDTGKIQAYPVNVAYIGWSLLRSIPGGREVLVKGSRIGPGMDAAVHLLTIDLAAGNVKQLPEELPGQFSSSYALGATPDGKHALTDVQSGSIRRVVAVPLEGHEPARTLLNLQQITYGLDTGPDGSIYVDQNDRTADIVRFTPALAGDRPSPVQRLATLGNLGGSVGKEGLAVLPDGRVVSSEEAAGRSRLVLIQAGKDPVPIVNTSEETSVPVTAAGPGEVAFMIGPPPHSDIAVASVSNGRITHRISFDKGRVEQMAASPDGKTIYCVAAGEIWAVPVSGEAPRKIRTGAGVTVDAATQTLVIQVWEPPNTRLVRVPLSGGQEQEIAGSFHIGLGIDPGGIHNGKLLAPLPSPYWWDPPGILDLASGKSTRIPLDFISDFHHLAWAPDGSIVALVAGWRSSIWKFTPVAP
jgi:predicted Ser/Thr protein kinase